MQFVCCCTSVISLEISAWDCLESVAVWVLNSKSTLSWGRQNSFAALVANWPLHEHPFKCLEDLEVLRCIGSVGCCGTFEKLTSPPCHMMETVSVIALYEWVWRLLLTSFRDFSIVQKEQFISIDISLGTVDSGFYLIAMCAGYLLASLISELTEEPLKLVSSTC